MKSFCLDVWGRYGCFSMFSPERISYPIITPSAARGIFDAIYWHPGMRWQIDKVEMLSMPRYVSIPFNGVTKVVEIKKPSEICASEDRVQLQVMALCDLRYRLHGHIVLFQESSDMRNKFESIYQRRAEHGKCAHQPFFGMREMVAFFKPSETDETPVQYNTVIPNMLYDVFDLSADMHQASKTLDITKVRRISLFDAKVFDGIMRVPPYEGNEVKK